MVDSPVFIGNLQKALETTRKRTSSSAPYLQYLRLPMRFELHAVCGDEYAVPFAEGDDDAVAVQDAAAVHAQKRIEGVAAGLEGGEFSSLAPGSRRST